MLSSLSMLRRWRIACVAGALAATIVLRFVLGARAQTIDAQTSAVPEPVSYKYVACTVPVAWATYPVVAHLDTARATSSVTEDGLFNDVHAATAPLGDVFARYEWDQCTAGGSACAGSSRSLHHVRLGPLDEHGEPALRTDFRCSGTTPFDQNAKARRTCDPATIALRRVADGETSVVTMRDPDAEETPIGAFTRTLVTPRPRAAARAEPRHERMLLIVLATSLFLAGAWALMRAGRFVRRGGILSWQEASVARGMVEIPGESPVALAPGLASTAVSTVLLAPSSIIPTTTYRELPAMDGRSIFCGSRSDATRRARQATSIALAAFATSIVTAAVGLLAYR